MPVSLAISLEGRDQLGSRHTTSQDWHLRQGLFLDLQRNGECSRDSWLVNGTSGSCTKRSWKKLLDFREYSFIWCSLVECLNAACF